MKLGEILVRDGRLTEAQVTAAIAHQAREGGRLGSIMVELGLLDLDVLTVYLGLELGIPIATGAALDRAKRSAVRLLTPDQAASLRCVPIVIQARQLIVAVDDPHDMETLERLAHITSYRPLPRVAPEIRLYYYIERYYGVPRPRRFAPMGDKPRGSRTAVSPDLPAPPLPGLPPIQKQPVVAPTPAPALRTQREAEPPPIPMLSSEDYEELEIEAEDLLIELEEDEADTATAPTPPDASAKKPRAPTEPNAVDEIEPADLEETLEIMRQVSQRTDVGGAIMSFATDLFDVAALFIVRDNMAFGWKAFGDKVDSERIETLLIPLDVQSVFHSAMHDEDGVFTGPTFPSTLHNYLYKVLRCARPAHGTVALIKIGRRLVNVLYGHKASGEDLTEEEQRAVRSVALAATAAYVRLITASKRGKQSAPPAAERTTTDDDTGDDTGDDAAE